MEERNFALLTSLLAVIACSSVVVPSATAGSADLKAAHERAPARSQTVQVLASDVRFEDLDLVDQDGRSVRFLRDVVGDNLVVMNFIFTTCPSVCPMQSAIFAGIQSQLGDRLGQEVKLVSVSIDPKTDVPQRLKAYAQRYDADDGWIWLTGEKQYIDRILVGAGAYSSDVAEHPAMILVGDGKYGGWTRFYGFPKPSSVLARVDELAGAREKRAVARKADESGDGRER
ncbi:MAG: SCO family protein [Candidatus Binatia bacterium]